MSTAQITVATEADVWLLAALRRAWVEEDAGPIRDDGQFERAFAAWYAAEAANRTTWLAALGADPVGMLNLVEFRRMPRPDRLVGRWGYIANVFVLVHYRGRGIGGQLLDAAVNAARERDYVRLLLSPSPRSVPFYRRAGFAPAGELMIMPLS